MKLTTKIRYGVRAILYIARNYKDRPTKRKEIVLEEDIPNAYLKNILTDLRTHGLILSIRGNNGGYVLSRDPDSMTMLEVVEALQGILTLVDCLEYPGHCERFKDCESRYIWEELQEAQRNILKKYTLRQLVDKDIKYNKQYSNL